MIYKLSWGENYPNREYPPQSGVPQEVQDAFAARDVDNKYVSLKKMADGMLAADADVRWTLEQVMVRAQQPAHRLALRLMPAPGVAHRAS